MAYMRDSARPFPLMCRHAAVAAFAAFSFHVMTASAEAALGHNTRSDTHTPMRLAICFIMDASLGDLQKRRIAIQTPSRKLSACHFAGVFPAVTTSHNAERFSPSATRANHVQGQAELWPAAAARWRHSGDSGRHALRHYARQFVRGSHSARPDSTRWLFMLEIATTERQVHEGTN